MQGRQSEFAETSRRTERLVLRPFGAADVPDTQASCSDPLAQRWLLLPRSYGLAEATAWCMTVSHELRRSGDGIQLAVADAVMDPLVG